jgi:hypothetical protein
MKLNLKKQFRKRHLWRTIWIICLAIVMLQGVRYLVPVLKLDKHFTAIKSKISKICKCAPCRSCKKIVKKK